MSVVVRNERAQDFHFTDERKRHRILEPGKVAVISEAELVQIPINKRGAGEINVLYPNEASAESNRTLFDYYDPGGGISEVRYLGVGQQGDPVDQPVWTIKRFSHGLFGAEWLVTDIQVLNDVRWDERATLGWT